MNIDHLDIKIDELDNEIKELSGSIKILEQQYNNNIIALSNLKELQQTNLRAIEILNFIQKITKDLVKDTFENIVTKALQFIHQDNSYTFELEFGRRGQIPELNFSVKDPEMQLPHEILNTRGGGSNDIISLALRFVLLEVSKTPGFIFLDEPEKHLDNSETLQKMIEFVKEMQRESNRQIFWITHQEEVVNSVSDAIIITDKNVKSEITNKEDIDSENKKKRGRPKKNDTKN